MPSFKVVAEFEPQGDQPAAVDGLAEGVVRGDDYQTLMGITGSGKTFTVAHLIEKVQKPTLVISPNKSLAAQLANEFRRFFPNNAVEYFVSYYDYYQPEAYVPQTDTYIEKDSSVNDEIERLRHSATAALLTRRDVLIVASVSCIYGLGSPEEYEGRILRVHRGVALDRDWAIRRLVDIQYQRNNQSLARGRFRVQGDTIEIHPAYDETLVRIELWGDDIERIAIIDPITGEVIKELDEITVYPATHYVAGEERMKSAIVGIEDELQHRLAELESHNKLLEAQRLRMRTTYDLEMLQEMGFCNGIENYSRHLSGRAPGSRPYTIIDFFPKDFLTVIDESHATIPQIGGMYEGDRSRKTVLVNYGFRLPSALDNRPLNFDEFMKLTNQIVYVSATPAEFEIQNSVVGNKGYVPHKRARIGEEELVPFILPGKNGGT